LTKISSLAAGEARLPKEFGGQAFGVAGSLALNHCGSGLVSAKAEAGTGRVTGDEVFFGLSAPVPP